MTEIAGSIITAELRSWIGRTTPLRALEILSASDIRRYADATGDMNPLWLDDESARAAGYRGRLLPPTLVGWVPFSLKENLDGSASDTIDLRRQLPMPEAYTNVRNAGSETEWIQPAFFGEQLSIRSCVVDIVARQGRAGLGIYVTQEEQVLNAAEEIVMRRRHTIALFPEKQFPSGRQDQK